MINKELPRGWAIATLQDVCTRITDGTHKTPDYRSSGIRFISIKNIKPFQPIDWDAYSRFITVTEHAELCKRCKPEFDDILFPRIGTLGYAKRIDFAEEISIFVGLGLLKPDKLIVTAKYLEYYMNTPWIAEMSHDRANGSGRLTLPLEESRKFPVLLAPLAEQRRIVGEIEKQFTRLDSAVAALKRIQVNLKRYRAAVLKAACEGRLVPTEAELARRENRSYEPASVLLERILAERQRRWQVRQLAKARASGKDLAKGDLAGTYNNPPEADESSLPSLPQGWKWATLSQLSEIQGGIQKQPSRRPAKHPYPFLRVANVLRGKLDTDEMHDVELFEGELEKLRLDQGDLLIVEGNGSPSEIGRMAIWKSEIKNCVHQNHIIRARLLGGISSKYVEAFWNSPRGAATVLEVASSTSGLYTLSVSKVGRIPIPLPPSAEQIRIVEDIDRRLSSVEEIGGQMGSDAKRAARLRQAILKQAFEGKLVPQDPSNEPASVFLERIRTERKTKSGSVKSKKQAREASVR